MSTPSTATATLVPHNSLYGYSHHQNYQPATTSTTTTNYRTNATSSGRLGLINPGPSSHSGTYHTNATNSSYSTKLEQPNTMPVQHSSTMVSSKKRQRSKEPDWDNFYKNGLPKEVIVIDDSPPPPARIPDSVESPTAMKQSTRSAAAGSSKHAAKKRKRDDGELAYDPIYPQLNSSTQNKNASNSVSTTSTDRTTSAIHTTAATSLGSQYSHNTDNARDVDTYETNPQVGSNKRKRVATRQQIANEAKRKEIEVRGDAFTNYKAPPRPPIKCGDVEVPLKQDVSFILVIDQ